MLYYCVQFSFSTGKYFSSCFECNFIWRKKYRCKVLHKKKKRKEEEEKGKDSLHRILTLLIFIYTVIEYESLYTRAKGERKDKEEDMNILREG